MPASPPPSTASITQRAASYIILGNTECPYFALAERLGRIIETAGLADVDVRPTHPDRWAATLRDTCRLYGFSHTLSPIVWTKAGRYVGGSNEFQQEVNDKYAVVSDITSLKRLRAIAQENKHLFLAKEEVNKPKVSSFGNVFKDFPADAGGHFTPAQLQTVWSRYDVDENGVLGQSEVAAMLSDILEFTIDAVVPRLSLALKRAGASKDAIDASATAMVRGVRSADVAQLSVELCAQMDVNGDGHVSEKEFYSTFVSSVSAAVGDAMGQQ